MKVQHFPWILAVVLVVWLTAGIFLYWQNAINLGSLTLWILGMVMIGFLFVYGIRIAQKDGFINGFRNGRNGFKKIKKKPSPPFAS